MYSYNDYYTSNINILNLNHRFSKNKIIFLLIIFVFCFVCMYVGMYVGMYVTFAVTNSDSNIRLSRARKIFSNSRYFILVV